MEKSAKLTVCTWVELLLVLMQVTLIISSEFAVGSVAVTVVVVFSDIVAVEKAGFKAE